MKNLFVEDPWGVEGIHQTKKLFALEGNISPVIFSLCCSWLGVACCLSFHLLGCLWLVIYLTDLAELVFMLSVGRVL